MDGDEQRRRCRRQVALAVVCPAIAGAVTLSLFSLLNPLGLLGHDYSIILLIHFVNFLLGTAGAVVAIVSLGDACPHRLGPTAVAIMASPLSYVIAFVFAKALGRAAGVGW